jgi:hypothetical protein
LNLNLFSPEFEITGRYNVREENTVIIDPIATTKEFGFYVIGSISECSFQQDGHDQKCLSNQEQTSRLCSNMKLDVLISNKACFIQNKGLTFKGIWQNYSVIKNVSFGSSPKYIF